MTRLSQNSRCRYADAPPERQSPFCFFRNLFTGSIRTLPLTRQATRTQADDLAVLEQIRPEPSNAPVSALALIP